jgi:hypothetical protein
VISAAIQSISTFTPRYSRLVAAFTGCSVFWPVVIRGFCQPAALGLHRRCQGERVLVA